MYMSQEMPNLRCLLACLLPGMFAVIQIFLIYTAVIKGTVFEKYWDANECSWN